MEPASRVSDRGPGGTEARQALWRNLPLIHPVPWPLFKDLRLCSGAAAPGPQRALGALRRRLTARSLLPPEPRLPQGEDRAESRVSPRKSDRLGLFYGEGEGAGSVASIPGLAGMESPDGESPVWVGDDLGDRVGSETVGSSAITHGTVTGRSWGGNWPSDREPEAHLPPDLSSPGTPLQPQAQPTVPALPPSQGRGRLSPPKHLIPTLFFWQEK